MTDHICEWGCKFDFEDGAECQVEGCKEWLNTDEIKRRLNATQRLSAKRVHNILEDRKLYSQDVLALHEYADTLEGK